MFVDTSFQESVIDYTDPLGAHLVG
jgi:hypothetical protein